MRISARGGISALYASVNFSCALPPSPPPPPLPRAGPKAFCLELQIPGDGTLKLSNTPGWGLKKRASAPFSVNTAKFFKDRTDRIVPF